MLAHACVRSVPTDVLVGKHSVSWGTFVCTKIQINAISLLCTRTEIQQHMYVCHVFLVPPTNIYLVVTHLPVAPGMRQDPVFGNLVKTF